MATEVHLSRLNVSVAMCHSYNVTLRPHHLAQEARLTGPHWHPHEGPHHEYFAGTHGRAARERLAVSRVAGRLC